MSHYVFRSQLFWSLLCHMLYLEASPSVHSFFFVSILLIFRPFLVLFGIVLSFFSYKVLIALFYGFSLQYFGPTSEGTLHNRLLCCLLRCLSFPSYYVSNLFCGQPHTTFHGKILSQVQWNIAHSVSFIQIKWNLHGNYTRHGQLCDESIMVITCILVFVHIDILCCWSIKDTCQRYTSSSQCFRDTQSI